MRLRVISYDWIININEIKQLGDMAERLPFVSCLGHVDPFNNLNVKYSSKIVQIPDVF